MDDLQSLLEDINDAVMRETDRGKVANYIPELAKQDNQQFGMAIATLDGQVFSSGCADTAFSIQSISKVFTLTMALGQFGDDLWARVGKEPSGSAFNSIVQLEHENGIPRNPFINAGAIVVADTVLAAQSPSDAIQEILQFVRTLAQDNTIMIDKDVAVSEAQTGFRNAALANYMRSFGNLDHPVDATLTTYFNQCAIAMSCIQLARAGLFLANGGLNPQSGLQVVPKLRVQRINALMMTCGHYDGSGEFAFTVGLPGKSGVGGGILVIVPGRAAIAVWSPGLDSNGNSKLGKMALEMLVAKTGWNIFST
ncbi:MAG: glutaminase [Sedimentitalea sp.]